MTPSPPDLSVKLWGSSAWRTIHSIAYAYDLRHHQGLLDASDRDAARAFFQSLRHLLPCSTCRSGLIELLDSSEVATLLQHGIDSGKLFAWSVQLHNAVNAKLMPPNKRDNLMTLENARDALMTPPMPPPIPTGMVCAGGVIAAGLIYLVRTLYFKPTTGIKAHARSVK